MEKSQKSPNKKNAKYYCKKCDYTCSNKKDFKKHKLTAKHLRGEHGNKKNPIVEFSCEICGKGYKHRSGLSRHRKKCQIIKNTSVESGGEMVTNVTIVTQKNDNIKNPKTEIEKKNAEINELKIKFPHLQLTYFQSNVEGELINKLHEVGFSAKAIILNAGGYTHTSVAIADAISAIKTPVIEDTGAVFKRPSVLTPDDEYDRNRKRFKPINLTKGKNKTNSV